MKSLKSASLGDSLHIINIEVSLSPALPTIEIVGLAGATIKESTTRVKAALSNLQKSCEQAKLPAMRVSVNLSPSDVKKNGSHFDLPIALLIMLQKIRFDNDFFVFGELGLDGNVRSSAELFSILLFLSTKVKNIRVLVPQDIALKAAMIPNLEVFSISNLEDAFRFFCDDEFAKSCAVTAMHPLFEHTLNIAGQIFVPNTNYELNFSDIKGQERAKRACVISAAGMHNILFEGSPGCGKSMSAKRLRYILPPQSLDEVLLASAYASLNSQDSDFSALRPYRAPHHTSTRSSIFGGGSQMAKIGEVALANGGVLFFDELPHFGKQILESMREPLEDNCINISRVNSKVRYETKFLFASAMNPCACGNAFSQSLNCRCSERDIARYKSAISAPLIDRIDLYVAMSEISANDASSVTSEQMHAQVMQAFNAQILRKQGELNGKLGERDIARFCQVDNMGEQVLNKAISSYHLTQRGINKTLKVARTIADLSSCEQIQKEHLIEALSFRMR